MTKTKALKALVAAVGNLPLDAIDDELREAHGAAKAALLVKKAMREAMATPNPPPAPALKPLLVTTDKRGVFFGYGTGEVVDGVTFLDRAQMCVYWSADVKGVMGLAATGPTKACKVTAAPPRVRLSGVTMIAECTDAAAKAWEAKPWA